MNALRPKSKQDTARVHAIEAAIASGQTIAPPDTGAPLDHQKMLDRALGKEEPSAKKRLMVFRFHQWLTAEINQSVHLSGAEAEFWHAAKLYLAEIGKPYPFDMTCGMANKLIWEREFSALMITLAFADELQPHSEFVLDKPTFEQVQESSRKLMGETACAGCQDKIKAEVAITQKSVLPQDLQSADDVLPPYGFTKQKQRLLNRIDELIEACKRAIGEPDNEDAQQLVDGYSIDRRDGSAYLCHPDAKTDLNIGTVYEYDCQRWALVQFVRKVKYTPKKQQAGEFDNESEFFRGLYTKQTRDLVAASEKVIKHPLDNSLRRFFPLGCVIEEEEHGLWLHHPVLENDAKGVQIASRQHKTAPWEKTIDEAEIRKLVITIRDRNDEKRAEQSRAAMQATAKAGVPAA